MSPCLYHGDFFIEENMPYKDIEKRRASSLAYYRKNSAEMNKKKRDRYQTIGEAECRRLQKYREENKDKVLKRQRDGYRKATHGDAIPTYTMKRRSRAHGITVEEYRQLLDSCNHRCLICGSIFINRSNSPCVDHDHVTMKVRGLLCTRCNTGLGMFRDNPDLLLKASEYLSYKNPNT